MAVKLELYRIFRTVAEEESISAAAKTLFISQSAVSQSIHQLEEQLQVRLFSRQPRGVTLTGEGRVLYDYVRSAISLIETGEEKVQQTRELMMGELVIGASDTVTRSLLLPYLQRFHERYPAIRLKVLNGTSYEALQMLRAGQVDLAFASTPQESGNLQMRRCMALHNVFVAGRDYPCETDRAYTLAELSRFPLAAIGLGVACVTREYALPALEAGTIRELRTIPEIPERSLSVCTLQDVSPSPAAEEFLRFWA